MILLPDLVQLIKKAAVEAVENAMPAGVYFGEVMSASPLKISLDQKMVLTDRDLILTTLVKDLHFSVTGYDVNVIANSGATGDYMLHLALAKGDKVILVRAQGGQKFVVLDKVR
ncbi:MAG: DUF2577 domain-containing protein [Bacillota bacterium]|nr:DUF2577 domain-containing protein [Bacillota bacterium]